MKIKLGKGASVRYESVFDFDEARKLGLFKTKKKGIIFLDMFLLNEWAERIPAWRRYLFSARLFEEGLRWDKAVEYCQ